MLHICLACGVFFEGEDSGTTDGRVLGRGAIGERELLSTDRNVVNSARLLCSLVAFRAAQSECRKFDIEMNSCHTFPYYPSKRQQT